VRWLGVGFAVSFAAASTVLLGDVIGAFADDPSSFAYFDTVSKRLRHAAGAYLLTASGLAFLAFVVGATSSAGSSGTSPEGRLARFAAAVFAALVGLAAAALATVSLSIGYGRITGDPGIQQAQELLPQLGYVVLFVPAALSGGCAIYLLARDAARTSRLPSWLVRAGYVVAATQLVSFYTLPLLLVPLWVLAAAITLRPG
jgi:hypothetical protein